MKVFDCLIGKRIDEVLVGDSDYSMVFVSEGVSYGFTTEGDCCNDVWFAHVNGVDAIVGATVLEIESKGWTDVEATRDECEEAAFWTFKTTGGYFDIEVRNSHNGYYGGRIVGPRPVSTNGLRAAVDR